MKPHKRVTTQIISRRILEVFDLSGINRKVFTCHLKTSASTSKAKASGVSSSDILKREYWTQTSTLDKFYQKEILPEREEFRYSVLKQI